MADFDNNKIRKINLSNNVSTFAGTGQAGIEDGNVSESKFRAPIGVDIDSLGNIFVVDRDNGRIRKIDNSGNQGQKSWKNMC